MKKSWIYLTNLVLFLCIVFSNVNLVSAGYKSETCDNGSTKAECADWFTGDFDLENDTDSWGNDYRINYDGAGVYWWEFTWDEPIQLMSPEVWVYLNETKFRADAMYMAKYDDSGFGTVMVGSIDQNTAPGGWNYIGEGEQLGFGSNITTIYVYAFAGVDNDNLGADAVKVREETFE
ncbi:MULTISPECIES: hypothetical protein [Brevibacillus]|uniref:hypothetical protein n=1 Tax=Brevibacillus TaxID=55080 RepID=UPI001C8D6B4A|nr:MULTISPECIES: hypothetical protein [Brevibacillus]MBY0085354.1 hypothetical protein [Brevibacillus brevis]MCE0450427.1 hypothetical protein [Brevibacillus sp. AF8]